MINKILGDNEIEDLLSDTIAVTVYSLISSTVFVKIEKNKNFEDKWKITNDIAMDVYRIESEISDVYEKIHDVRFAENNGMSSWAEHKAVLNSEGKYELVEI